MNLINPKGRLRVTSSYGIFLSDLRSGNPSDRRRILGIGDLAGWLEKKNGLQIIKEGRTKVANTAIYRQTERWKFDIRRG